MRTPSELVITSVAERPRETWGDPSKGGVAWYTFFSGGLTPTDSLTAGIAELVPGGHRDKPHRHEQAELYYILEGTGILTVDGSEHTVSAGQAVFIPGNAEHSMRNETDTIVCLLYVFAADSFADITYRFDE